MKNDNIEFEHNIKNLFTTPVYFSFLKNEKTINLIKLKKYIFSLVKKSNGRVKSNSGGWQSHNINLQDKEVVNLNKIILDRVKIYADAIYFKKTLKPIIANAWFNINDYGNSNIEHIHPQSHISGTFYIQTTDKTGDIVFINPDLTMQYAWPEYIIEETTEWNSEAYLIKSEQYKLLLFPSFARHRVNTNFDKRIQRISYSFNINLVE